jgi:hypothetical protein
MPPPKDSGLGIGALVCSLVGIVHCGVLSIAGVVMGHVAYNVAYNKAKRGETGGTGMATAAIIIGYMVIAGWIALIHMALNVAAKHGAFR